MKHYFPHDYSAHTDQKILRLRYKYGAEGYGVYWMILETMAQDTTGYINSEDIGGLSLGYGVAIDTLKAIIDYCVEIGLFMQCKHGNYYSQRMINHKEDIAKYSEYGRKGAEIRWNNRGAIAPLIAPAMQLNKIKRNKIKENNNINNNIPEIGQVRDYCKERGNLVNADTWYDFYSAKGWMIGKNKMKDWKAAVRTWENNNKKRMKSEGKTLEQYKILN